MLLCRIEKKNKKSIINFLIMLQAKVVIIVTVAKSFVAQYSTKLVRGKVSAPYWSSENQVCHSNWNQIILPAISCIHHSLR